MGGDAVYNGLGGPMYVSIHAPAWGATIQPWMFGHGETVSIHAPAWGATYTTRACYGIKAFQSTPPRGGRRHSIPRSPGPCKVSIHAPAWGATGHRVVLRGFLRVSIHAPAWGATTYNHNIFFMALCFNPRPRVGGDGSRLLDMVQSAGFNPRPRVGGDRISIHFSCFLL